jgi:hypothetical protein
MLRTLVLQAALVAACSSFGCSSPSKNGPAPPTPTTTPTATSDAGEEPTELWATPDGVVSRVRIDAGGAPADGSVVDSSMVFGKHGDVCDGPNAAHCGPNLSCCYPCGARGCRRICQPRCQPLP